MRKKEHDAKKAKTNYLYYWLSVTTRQKMFTPICTDKLCMFEGENKTQEE